ncbi:MAG: lactate utilization protein [archaeon]
MEPRILKTVESLKRHGIGCIPVKGEAEAKAKILELIPEGASVGLGGSMTVAQTGVVPELEKRGKAFNPYTAEGKIDKTKNQPVIRRDGLTAEYFLTGTNSITEDGYLVNTDGTGNRIAAMAYGPKKVILVAGTNKIVKDVPAAFERIKSVAAPKNARRHGWDDLPCHSGKCADCAAPHRQCNASLIIHNSREKGRITVILIDKELGY